MEKTKQPEMTYKIFDEEFIELPTDEQLAKMRNFIKPLDDNPLPYLEFCKLSKLLRLDFDVKLVRCLKIGILESRFIDNVLYFGISQRVKEKLDSI